MVTLCNVLLWCLLEFKFVCFLLSILFNISVATPVSFLFLFACSIFFHPFSYDLCVSSEVSLLWRSKRGLPLEVRMAGRYIDSLTCEQISEWQDTVSYMQIWKKFASSVAWTSVTGACLFFHHSPQYLLLLGNMLVLNRHELMDLFTMSLQGSFSPVRANNKCLCDFHTYTSCW